MILTSSSNDCAIG